MRVKTRTATAMLAGVVLLAAGSAALAAPAQVDPPATKVADAAAVRTAATDASEDEGAGCSRSRKRLWIEGEGWIVRRVTICH